MIVHSAEDGSISVPDNLALIAEPVQDLHKLESLQSLIERIDAHVPTVDRNDTAFLMTEAATALRALTNNEDRLMAYAGWGVGIMARNAYDAWRARVNDDVPQPEWGDLSEGKRNVWMSSAAAFSSTDVVSGVLAMLERPATPIPHGYEAVFGGVHKNNPILSDGEGR